MTTPPRPKAVAYLRIDPEDTDGLTAMREKLFSEYAAKHHFDLCHIEFEPGNSLAVGRIGQIIEQYRARHFLVLSMENVTAHPVLSHSLKEALTYGSGAEVHEIETDCPRNSGP
ncbi:hypothetical protein ABTZ78_14370 [Streptomyces bauhiniae]|uniref:hypothetical protein n=1 Tax=Streptomyces bauhiniae TaxID=2340725 RepID=UPI003319CEAC